MSARTGWPANDIRESLVNDNDWSCGFDLKSEHGNVIVTTGGHGVAAGPDAEFVRVTLLRETNVEIVRMSVAAGLSN